jgi:hypothetical protein
LQSPLIVLGVSGIATAVIVRVARIIGISQVLVEHRTIVSLVIFPIVVLIPIGGSLLALIVSVGRCRGKAAEIAILLEIAFATAALAGALWLFVTVSSLAIKLIFFSLAAMWCLSALAVIWLLQGGVVSLKRMPSVQRT